MQFFLISNAGNAIFFLFLHEQCQFFLIFAWVMQILFNFCIVNASFLKFLALGMQILISLHNQGDLKVFAFIFIRIANKIILRPVQKAG